MRNLRYLSLIVFTLVCFLCQCSADESQKPNAVYADPTDDTLSTQGSTGASVDDSIATFGQDAVVSQEGPNETVGVKDAGFDPENCATYTAAAKQIEVQVEKQVPVEITEEHPVSIYIMLDRSTSMLAPDPEKLLNRDEAPNLWAVAGESIRSFINDPSSAGINVALQFFPLIASCDGSVYDTPSVPMGRLPDNATAIWDALYLAMATFEDTPVESALLGATRYCKAFKNDPVANPNREDCAVVFITDGTPSTCNTDAAYLANIAGDAYKEDGITTFAVGMEGADFNLLNLIAEQGQGPNDCHPDDPDLYCCNVNANMTLLQALEFVRTFTRIETHIEYETVIETEALPCEWKIPSPPENEVLDKDKVNVEFSDGAQSVYNIPKVERSAECGDHVAWYYDETATHIVACPEACTKIQSAELATINIVLGCVSVIIE